MAVGKNLFAFFSSHGKDGDSDDLVVMHVHFGMSGMWAVFNSTMEASDAKRPKVTINSPRRYSIEICRGVGRSRALP